MNRFSGRTTTLPAGIEPAAWRVGLFTIRSHSPVAPFDVRSVAECRGRDSNPQAPKRTDLQSATLPLRATSAGVTDET